MATLVDVTDELCEVLQRYEKVRAEVAGRVERGELLADALGAAGGLIPRVEVTDARLTRVSRGLAANPSPHWSGSIVLGQAFTRNNPRGRR
jgi:hypothetical protein